MARCTKCRKSYEMMTDDAICVTKFGECVSCKIDDETFSDNDMAIILFLADDLYYDDQIH